MVPLDENQMHNICPECEMSLDVAKHKECPYCGTILIDRVLEMDEEDLSDSIEDQGPGDDQTPL
jgi:hypothetical protein